MPVYTENLKRGDDGGQVYWRAFWALQDDPIASMLSEKTLKGLSSAYFNGMVDKTTGNARFSNSGAVHWAKEVIQKSPLSLLSKEAQVHLANVISTAMFPKGFDA